MSGSSPGCLIGAVGLLVLGTTHDLAPGARSRSASRSGRCSCSTSSRATIVQRLVPDEERGRAMGFAPDPERAWPRSSAPSRRRCWPISSGSRTALAVIAIVSTVLGLAAVVVLRPSGVLVTSGLDPRRLELLRASVFGGVLPIRLEAAARRLVAGRRHGRSARHRAGRRRRSLLRHRFGDVHGHPARARWIDRRASDDGSGRRLRRDRPALVRAPDGDRHGCVGRAGSSPWTATASLVSWTPGRA